MEILATDTKLHTIDHISKDKYIIYNYFCGFRGDAREARKAWL